MVVHFVHKGIGLLFKNYYDSSPPTILINNPPNGLQKEIQRATPLEKKFQEKYTLKG